MTRSNNARGQPSGGTAADNDHVMNSLAHARNYLTNSPQSRSWPKGRLRKAALLSDLTLEFGVYPERELAAGVDHIQNLL